MLLRFWGVRGSIPTPSPAHFKYGGNTACIEIRSSDGQLIVLDAGSGLRPFGRRLVSQPPETEPVHMFLTHYHWDHIQGFPFFEPLYSPQQRLIVHGFSSVAATAAQALGEQMANPYFPVDMSVLRADIRFSPIGEETLELGGMKISTRQLNHPQGCLGYRIEEGGRVIVLATDHEQGREPFDSNVRALAENADLLIYDAQFTEEEYEYRKGWGHSTWREGIHIAREAGVKHLMLFHHDPNHDDFMVDSLVQRARQEFPNVHGAMEGMEVDLAAFSKEVAYHLGLDKRYNLRHRVPLPVSVRLRDPGRAGAQTVVENLSLDGAFFLTDDPLPAGTQIEVEIELAPPEGSESRIKASARVVRCEKIGQRAGIGITFR